MCAPQRLCHTFGHGGWISLHVTSVSDDFRFALDGLGDAVKLAVVSLILVREELPLQPVFRHYPHSGNQDGIPSGAVRIGDFKLVERYEDGRVHLYNLKDDIGEQHDLAAEYPRKVAGMRAQLHTWYKEVDAKFLQSKDGGPMPWWP